MSLKSRLPGVDWSNNGKTLVIAISTQCPFCKESTPFYRKLRGALGNNIKLVAVLPQPAADAEQFLNSAGVRFDQVKQAALGEIGVRGTPTMLLVNAAGKVMKIWTGKVQPEDEERVLSDLKG